MDFSIQSGNSAGPRIEIMPGNNEPERELAVSVDEETFFLVEAFILRLAPQVSFNHYGPNKLESHVWKLVLETFEQEAARLGGPPHPEWITKQAPGRVAWDSGDIQKLKNFAFTFAQAQNSWFNQFSSVFIFGV